jgi:DNA-directed RNA polymerase sigma subunit (sigma70/sigma32)
VAAQRAAIAGVIRETVREMRQTMSLAQVAVALGITRGRVQQLEKPVAD